MVHFVNMVSHRRWNRKMGMKDDKKTEEICLCSRWIGFSCIPISTQSPFCPSFTSPSSKSSSFRPSRLFNPFQFLFLEVISIPLYCHSIFPPPITRCIFNLAMPELPSSKVHQGEVWYIFPPNCTTFTALGRMARWFTINQTSSGLAPGPLVRESDLAEWNKLTRPTAEWWMKRVHQSGENLITDWL